MHLKTDCRHLMWEKGDLLTLKEVFKYVENLDLETTFFA